MPPRLPPDTSARGYRSQDVSLLAAADANSAICLRIYERQSGYEDDHGARRFAIFCLGMEARTAYEWFYGDNVQKHSAIRDMAPRPWVRR